MPGGQAAPTGPVGSPTPPGTPLSCTQASQTAWGGGTGPELCSHTGHRGLVQRRWEGARSHTTVIWWSQIYPPDVLTLRPSATRSSPGTSSKPWRRRAGLTFQSEGAAQHGDRLSTATGSARDWLSTATGSARRLVQHGDWLSTATLLLPHCAPCGGL